MRVTNDLFLAEFLCIVPETFTCALVWFSFIDLANANIRNSTIHVRVNTSIANKIEVFNAACSLLHAADAAD